MPGAGTKPPSNVGCAIAIVALPIVILIGVIIGTVLRSDDDEPEEVHDTLQTGELGGVAWKVDAVLDVDGQTCAFLYEEDAEDPVNGTCDQQPQDVTYGDRTVVFGKAKPDDTKVAVELDGGEVVDVQTVEAGKGIGGRFYVTVVDGDVDAVALRG